MTSQFTVGLYPVPNLPLINIGEDVGKLIFEAATASEFTFEDNDIVVVAQKVVSKAEGAVVRLSDIVPSPLALELAEKTGRDPRLCQVYIDQSSKILRVKGRMVITRHRLGFECSGAGVDRSNVAAHDDGVVVLLPQDPDASARNIRTVLSHLSGRDMAVIISDSFGRADRDGSVGMAIGLAGIRHLEERSQADLFGNPSNSRIALVDELAASASILMGQADESRPVVVLRGVAFSHDESASIKRLLIEE